METEVETIIAQLCGCIDTGTLSKYGVALNGEFGVSPDAIKDYFNQNGYNTKITTTTNVIEINNIGKNYDTVIATVYNDKNDITQMIHTVCITKQNGEYVIHNAYEYDSVLNKYIEKADKYKTLEDAITNIGSNSVSISIIGIDNPCKSK